MTYENYIQNMCTGCGLCENVGKAKLEKKENGFYVPNNIEDFKFFEDNCPMFYYCKNNGDFKLWGEIVSAYAGYSSNKNIRHRASTGGALTELSIYLIEHEIVDGIIHVASDDNVPIETKTVISTTREEIISRCGSRYSISSPLKEILDIVEEDKKYAFIGKPCDVLALTQYMQSNRELSKQIVFTMSFFCAGLPSADANKELLNNIGCPISDCSSLQYRGNGWPGYTTAVNKDGKSFQIKYAVAWGSYLGRDVNKICRYCMDGIGEKADIVCADLWHINSEGKPDFSEHDGRNIIICRTNNGDKIVRDAIKANNIIAENYLEEMGSFRRVQIYQFFRRTTMHIRLLTLRIFGRFAPKYDKKMLRQTRKYSSPIAKFNVFVGTVKRIIKGVL